MLAIGTPEEVRRSARDGIAVDDDGSRPSSRSSRRRASTAAQRTAWPRHERRDRIALLRTRFALARLLAYDCARSPQGNAPAAARQEQPHGRVCSCRCRADPDLRLWPVVRRQERAGRDRDGGHLADRRRTSLAGFYLSPYFSPVPLTSMHEAEQLMRERKVDGDRLRCTSDFSRQLAAGDATIQVLVQRRRRESGACAAGVCAGRASANGAAKRAAAGEAARCRRRRASRSSSATLVQRGEHQHLLSRSRADRADHDAERRAADVAGHGARMGARHARSAVRHAGQVQPRSSSRSSFRTSCVGLVGLAMCLLAARSFCSTCRFAARCC